MTIRSKQWLACLTAATCAAVLTAGCGAAPTPTPEDEDIPFTLHVLPDHLQGFSIAGQHVVFLVTFTDEEQADAGAVVISAEAEGAAVSILHASVAEGEAAEIDVVPDAASTGGQVKVTFTGTRGGLTADAEFTFDVIEGTDDRKDYAEELQARFISWLAADHPELGITAETAWLGTMVSPQWLVVSHYLFFSDEWEMHIEWHIMIAPDDWMRIDLRHRFDETKPSKAFEISSVTENGEPISIAVPETIWR